MSELVTDHLEHALPLGKRLGVWLHLLLCAACRQYFEQMRATVRLLGAGLLPPPPPQVEAEVIANLPDGGDHGVE
jgi:hypothetical protein